MQEDHERNEPKEQPITPRFPRAVLAAEVLAALKEQAQQHERSFNGEVIWALRDYIERYMNHTQPGKR